MGVDSGHPYIRPTQLNNYGDKWLAECSNKLHRDSTEPTALGLSVYPMKRMLMSFIYIILNRGRM